jgi:hypothetical protein
MRPSQRRPQKPAGRPAAAATADTLSTATAIPTADLALASGGAAAAAATAPRVAGSADVRRGRTAQASSLLTQRAEQEYAYVARDLRHIVVVAGTLLMVLLVIWFLVEVLHVITI